MSRRINWEDWIEGKRLTKEDVERMERFLEDRKKTGQAEGQDLEDSCPNARDLREVLKEWYGG